jgi:hypothetical protein
MAKAKNPNRPERLSRKDMEDLIKSGQSIIHDGQMITRVEDLPTDVDLALGDPAKEDATEAEINRQIKALEDLKSQLQAGKSKPKAETAKATNDAEPAKPAAPEATPDDKAAQRAKILGETKSK